MEPQEKLKDLPHCSCDVKRKLTAANLEKKNFREGQYYCQLSRRHLVFSFFFSVGFEYS